MAISRSIYASSDDTLPSGTGIPSDHVNGSKVSQRSIETSDIRDVGRQYQDEAESKGNERVSTGTMLPKDLTVKLVRADTANWETFLSLLYSIMMTLFGVFLGSYLSNSDNPNSKFSTLEFTATISFGVLSLILIGVWVVIKVFQQRGSVRVSHSEFETIKDEAEPADGGKG